MPSQFLDTLSFPNLIAPVSVETFLSEYWEKKPLVVHRNESDYYDELLTLEDFDRAIATSPSYVKTAEAKSKTNAKTDTDSTKGMELLLAQMRSGSTLVLDQLHQREPKLTRLCRVLQAELGHTFQTNCYLTPAKGAGFTPHWDNHDVFILQVMGSKHWKVENKRRRLPSKTEFMTDEEGRHIGEDSTSFTLKQGDLIYIPRGVVHAAECGADASLHITLGVHARTWDELLNSTISQLVSQDESMRYALPAGFMTGSNEKLAAGVTALLRRAMKPEHINQAIDRFRDSLVTKTPADVSGQIVDHFRPRKLDLNVNVGPRHGTVCTMYDGQDSLLLNYAGRSLTFPDFFKPGLVFALNTPSYAIAELPGELEEEEKIVFIERLIQEGLVVRR